MSFKTVIDHWPTITELSCDIRVARARVQKWRQRNSIPSAYWSDILKAAKHRGYSISIDDFLSAASNKEAA